ncbi:MAG: hypothetical protein [Microviridae sp.]|nr:MAG: hypothetical protein [Microviridae sp.]
MNIMKQAETRTQKSNKTQPSEQLLSVVKETPKLNSTGSNELNEQGEELVQREEIENTPFVMITINNESFGTFGKYRITEMYHTKAQCKIELKSITWNRIIQIMSLLNEMLNEKNIK